MITDPPIDHTGGGFGSPGSHDEEVAPAPEPEEE